MGERRDGERDRDRQTEAERKRDREILFCVPLIIRPSNNPRLPSVYPEPGAVLDTSQETAFLQLGVRIRNLQGSLWPSRIFGHPEQRQWHEMLSPWVRKGSWPQHFQSRWARGPWFIIKAEQRTKNSNSNTAHPSLASVQA